MASLAALHLLNLCIHSFFPQPPPFTISISLSLSLLAPNLGAHRPGLDFGQDTYPLCASFHVSKALGCCEDGDEVNTAAEPSILWVQSGCYGSEAAVPSRRGRSWGRVRVGPVRAESSED